MYLYMYVHLRKLHVRICTYMYAYVRTCTHMYSWQLHVRICTYMYAYVCIGTHLYSWQLAASSYMYVYVRTCTHMYSWQLHVRICMPVYILDSCEFIVHISQRGMHFAAEIFVVNWGGGGPADKQHFFRNRRKVHPDIEPIVPSNMRTP